MEQDKSTSQGQVKIATDVITTIASVAVNDSQFNDLCVKRGRNVTVRYEENEIIVDIDLIAKYDRSSRSKRQRQCHRTEH